MRRKNIFSRRYLRFFGPDVRADLNDEFEFHLQSKVAEFLEAGATPEAAQARALAEFGDLERVRDRCRIIAESRQRSYRRSEWMKGWANDFRYACRQLWRSALSFALAVSTLAFGIGAAIAVFSVVYAVVLNPLPFPEPDRIVTLSSLRNGVDDQVIPRNFDAWKRNSRAFLRLAAIQRINGTLTGMGDPVQTTVGKISADFFRVFGIRPALGRTFTAREDAPGQAHVAVLSHRLWHSRFAADPRVLGKLLYLNATAYTVIGVMPSSFDLKPDGETLWIPLALGEQEMSWSGGLLSVVGRLRGEATLREAQSEMRVLGRQLQIQYPDTNRNLTIQVRPYAADLVSDYRPRLLVLLAAVAFSLATACSNVANLLLARGLARQTELAVRAALGASRGRIMRQLLTESFLLALAAAASGIAIAIGLIRAIALLAGSLMPRASEVQLGFPEFFFAVLLAFACTLLIGALPAWTASAINLERQLRRGGRTIAHGSGDKMRGSFVAVEVCLSFVLLAGTAVCIQAALRAQAVRPGFVPARLLTARTALPRERYGNAVSLASTYGRLQSELAAIPGVASVALSSSIPLAGSSMGLRLHPSATRSALPNELSVNLRYLSDGYFATMGVPLREGREFSQHDDSRSAPVIILNQALAQLLFPKGHAVGESIRIPEFETLGPWQIVGVAGDMRENGLLSQAPKALYVPFRQIGTNPWQWTENALFVVLRTRSEADDLAGSVLAAVHHLDPDLPVGDVQSMNARLAASLSGLRLYSWLLMVLSAGGLLVTIAGIYGLVGYLVASQTQEISIRLALGATVAQVLGRVMKQGMKPVLFGMMSGLLIAGLLWRAASAYLGQVQTMGILPAVAAVIVLGGTAALACFLPAQEAARANPSNGLRGE